MAPKLKQVTNAIKGTIRLLKRDRTLTAVNQVLPDDEIAAALQNINKEIARGEQALRELQDGRGTPSGQRK